MITPSGRFELLDGFSGSMRYATRTGQNIGFFINYLQLLLCTIMCNPLPKLIGAFQAA